MRLFVAIYPNQELVKKLTSATAFLSQNYGASIRTYNRSQFHLTLKFLGEVPQESLEHICQALGNVAAESRPFVLCSHEIGCFPARGPAKVIYLNLNSKEDELVNLNRRSELAIAELGFEPPAHRFTPHITIGRLRRNTREPNLRRDLESLTIEPTQQLVESFFLVESKIFSDGARYEEIAQFVFSG